MTANYTENISLEIKRLINAPRIWKNSSAGDC
jgi:hypothetical protein